MAFFGIYLEQYLPYTIFTGKTKHPKQQGGNNNGSYHS
nr:MAG TPA: hypothetical protein [Caudoviricetes sp.]